MSKRLPYIALSLASFSLAGPVWAHDVWIVVNANKAAVAYGDTDARVLAEKSKIVSFAVVSPQAKDLRGAMSVGDLDGHPVFTADGLLLTEGSVLALTYDNGFWLKQPGDKGSTNTSKLLAPAGTSAQWTVKYAKALYGKGAFSQLAKTRMELIPLKDPNNLTHGEALPVRVVVDGKPQAGVDIRYGNGVDPVPDDDTPRVKTGADGVALVPMTGRGPQLLAADAYVAPKDPAYADQDHLYASLTFNRKP